MTISGIQITATFEPLVPFPDEWLEAVYSSIQGNMVIVSADMFVDEDESSISLHLAIDTSLASSDTFVQDVARDALEKAFNDASTGGAQDTTPVVVSGEVEAFA